MPSTVDTARFIAETVLHPIFSNGRFNLLPPGPDAQLGDDYRAAVARLRVSVKPDEKAYAKITDFEIQFSAGFLCERWSTSYRFAKVYHNVAGARDVYDVPVPPLGAPFEWPADVPDPSVRGNPVVDSTNKMFPWVFWATAMHEVGHATLRGSGANPQEIELRCDDFAMNYVLGKGGLTSQEFKAVGVAIWLCCLCAESLGYTMRWTDTHPHPVLRVEQFLEKYVLPYLSEDPQLGMALAGLCCIHVWDLARLRRPEVWEYAMEDFRALDSGDPMDMLDCLKACWD